MDKSHAQHIIDHFAHNAPWWEERNHFLETLCAAEFHWFFVQGLDAIRNEYYIPGLSSLLNGIEASLRVTIAQVSGAPDGEPLDGLSPYRVLSNNLILNAQEVGMPVEALAFPGEADFLGKLQTVKPNRVDVEVVRQRNNICHGDIFEFINRDLGPENSFFTPECVRPLAFTLLEVSHAWAAELGRFRRSKNLLHYDGAA
ncbi:hypothetical protein [Pseudoxanthomonas suwonensis]|uniref:hypothetical protein n=1 Tax=Pseudoxanthomonas suwonensis TaxID=314722 RepID=UPI0009D67DA4|nr:hypothetical protein [Pseudoxanthomonas suwonensis]